MNNTYNQNTKGGIHSGQISVNSSTEGRCVSGLGRKNRVQQTGMRWIISRCWDNCKYQERMTTLWNTVP
ncbi:mCG147444 [Mus musculus]|nr:mCG147444 [Mus musculus]